MPAMLFFWFMGKASRAWPAPTESLFIQLVAMALVRRETSSLVLACLCPAFSSSVGQDIGIILVSLSEGVA